MAKKKKSKDNTTLTLTREKFLYYRGLEAENKDLHDYVASATATIKKLQYLAQDLQRKNVGLTEQNEKLRKGESPDLEGTLVEAPRGGGKSVSHLDMAEARKKLDSAKVPTEGRSIYTEDGLIEAGQKSKPSE